MANLPIVPCTAFSAITGTSNRTTVHTAANDLVAARTRSFVMLLSLEPFDFGRTCLMLEVALYTSGDECRAYTTIGRIRPIDDNFRYEVETTFSSQYCAYIHQVIPLHIFLFELSDDTCCSMPILEEVELACFSCWGVDHLACSLQEVICKWGNQAIRIPSHGCAGSWERTLRLR